MAEFFNEAARQAHLVSLEREREGYEARKPNAKHGRDYLKTEELEDRIKQVDAELARIRGQVSVEETVVDEKPVAKLKPAELDAAFGHVDGYPADGTKADKVAFAEEHLDERQEV